MSSDQRSFRAQLTPIAAKLRPTYALIQPVSQVHVHLKPEVGKDRFAEAGKRVLQWMDRRAGRRLPQEAWELRSFELADVGAQRTAAVAIDEPRFWAARLDDADKNVPQRTWISEVGLGTAQNGDVMFGARLICASRGEGAAPFERTVPGFVRTIASLGKVGLDGTLITPTATAVVSTEADVDALIELLANPERRVGVVVFSLPVHGTDPRQTVVPSTEILEQTIGAAHLRILTGAATFHLTDRIGKELSVFDRAVRFYRPGFNQLRDHPSRHPLYFPLRIESWPNGTKGFSRHIIDQLLATTVQRADREDEVPAFNVVRQYAVEAERTRMRARGTSNDEMARLYEEDNIRLRRELEEQRELHLSLLETADRERDQAEQEAQEAKAQGFALRDRIRSLERRLTEAGNQEDDVPIPTSLDGFDIWCRDYLVGAVEVHSRALHGAKKSVYEDVTLLYRALLLLRDAYVPMKMQGGAERIEAYKRGCQALQLEDSLVGNALKTHRDRYTVTWNGKPRLLEHHLKKGQRHDETRCFRLYFLWDDETQCVVVGWLPSHLDNALT